MSNLGSAAVFDTGVPAVYGSVTKDQRDGGGGYLTQPPCSLADQLPPEDPALGTDSLLPSPDNEYDVIPGEKAEENERANMNSVRVGASSRSTASCRKQEAINELYEDNQLMGPGEYVHPALSPSEPAGYPPPVFSGETGQDYPPESESNKLFLCQSCTLVAIFFIAAAVLLSLASLTLSILLWFGIPTNPDCSCTSYNVQDIRERVSSLKSNVQQLQADVEESTMAALSQIAHGNSNLSQIVQEMEVIRNQVNVTVHQINESAQEKPPPLEVSLVLSNVSVYGDCNRTVVSMCELPVGNFGDIVSCNTSYVLKDEPGVHLLSANCLFLLASTTEQNTLVATLEERETDLRCQCRRITFENGFYPQERVECGLLLVKCPATQDFGSFVVDDSS